MLITKEHRVRLLNIVFPWKLHTRKKKEIKTNRIR